MVTIIRKFKCGVRVDFKDQLKEIFNEFSITYRHSHYHECEYRGDKIVNVYFEDCGILEERLDAFIKRLDKLPLQAGAIIKY